jgi:hypothetical protein
VKNSFRHCTFSVFGVEGGEQATLLILSREAKKYEHRAEQNRDDSGCVRLLIAG